MKFIIDMEFDSIQELQEFIQKLSQTKSIQKPESTITIEKKEKRKYNRTKQKPVKNIDEYLIILDYLKQYGKARTREIVPFFTQYKHANSIVSKRLEYLTKHFHQYVQRKQNQSGRSMFVYFLTDEGMKLSEDDWIKLIAH